MQTFSIVPEFLAHEGMKSGKVEYILHDWTLDPIDVFAAWPSNKPKNGLIKLLVRELSTQ